MKNIQRHKVVTLRRESYSEENNYTFYPQSLFIQGYRIDDQTFFQGDEDSGSFSGQDWITIYSSTPMPSVIFPEDPSDKNTTAIRSDYVYWQDKYYKILQEQDFARMGNKTHFLRYAQWKQTDPDAAEFPKEPPAFYEEYTPFIEAVGMVSMAVELSLKPLCSKIDECK